MSKDNTKLYFSSDWEIDQLYATASISVGSGTVAVYTFPTDIPALPVYHIQFKPTGSSVWYDPGTYMTSATLATQKVFYTYILSGTAYAVLPNSGTVRYFIWTDKVNY